MITGGPTEPGSAPSGTAAAARRTLGERATPLPTAKAATAAHIGANGREETSAQPLGLTATQAAAHGPAPRGRPPPAHSPAGSSAQLPKKRDGKERRPPVTRRISKLSTISGI